MPCLSRCRETALLGGCVFSFRLRYSLEKCSVVRGGPWEGLSKAVQLRSAPSNVIMDKYRAVPLAFFAGWLFAFIWDMADGPDQVPPWVVEECGE